MSTSLIEKSLSALFDPTQNSPSTTVAEAKQRQAIQISMFSNFLNSL
mgnify:CR=1 FL=1|jgi:hypothetical protein